MDARQRDGWQTASPYLDTALDLAPGERAAWLAGIRAERPDLADLIAAWLAECDALDDHAFMSTAAPVEPVRATLAGVQLGPWRLVSPIGHGGMGTVWLAERTDGRFDGRAAVKLLNASLVGRSGGDRFAREGRILARLAHPQIAHLLDAGVSEIGQPYLVLEYVEGEPIDAYCDRLRLSVADRVRLLVELMTPVAHAHANLVVHRDLKPSNVLVTPAGRVKLLDFGIARLLDDATAPEAVAPLTRAGDALLTPAYAAPEQVTGGHVSTATDVYSLGVLAYLLLTGRHPAAAALENPAALMHAITDVDPPRMSDAVRLDDAPGGAATRANARAVTVARLRSQLAGDLDTIVATALKKAPGERYASVDAFAADLRRHLANEPISARADAVLYRAAKFVRRNRWGVAAAAVVVTAISVGVYAVNRERAIATKRFEQVRELAGKLFDIEVQVRELPGGLKTRQMIVDTALNYLKGLSDDIESDPALALDVGSAYQRVARVQGVPVTSNLGQTDNAEASLQLAEKAIASVLHVQPSNQMALFRAAQIAHDRMVLAGDRRPDDGALPLARISAGWLEKFVAAGPVPVPVLDQALIIYNNVGNRFRIERDYDTAVRLTEQGIALAATHRVGYRQGGALQIGLARILRDQGRLPEAVAAIRRAQAVLKPSADDASSVGLVNSYTLTLRTEGQLLSASGVGLGQPADAVPPLRQAYDLLEPMVHRDAANSDLRDRVGMAALDLADALLDTNPAEALALYDHGLQHFAEVPDNAKIRRQSVRLLAQSTRALRHLHREAEIQPRLDTAFEILRAEKLYPATTIEPGGEVAEALAARADAEAARGRVHDAVRTYQALLDGVMAAEPTPETDLADAADVSDILAALAPLMDGAGDAAGAATLHARRLALWRQWDARLSGSAFVQRQLKAVRNAIPGQADTPRR